MSIELIVGLANPGNEYANTRHNVGAWFIDALAYLAHAHLRFENKYKGLYAQAMLHNKVCHLLIPTTYMNHSGQAVRACMGYLKIPPENILVVHDDIDLPAGSIKLKYDGGDGGHNGLKDIIRHLNTKQFHRLRIGVDHPGNSEDVADYVLAKPSKADRQKIEAALQNAEGIVPFLLEGDFQKAMQILHTTT